MAEETKQQRRRRREGYFWLTHRPLHCLVFIAPLMVLFHVGTLWYGRARLLAPQDLGRLLGWLGGAGWFLPPAMVVAVLLGQQAFRREPWHVNGVVISGMMGESIAFIVPLIVLSHVTGRFLAAAALAGANPDTVLRRLLVAMGAGVYEEFLFRLLLVSLLLMLLVDIFQLPKKWMALLAVAVSGVLFSLYHFSAAQLTGKAEFPWSVFTFRALAGVYLGALFVFRGFGVAVGTHTFYNLYALLLAG